MTSNTAGCRTGHTVSVPAAPAATRRHLASNTTQNHDNKMKEIKDMAGRIRSIKPELLEDDKTSALSDSAWRLFVSLWLLADDYGNARAGHRYLAAMVWQDTTKDAGEPLRELCGAQLVDPYEANGQAYVSIKGWGRHQRIDNAGKPRVPGPIKENQTLGLGFSEKVRKPRQVAARPTTPTSTPTPTSKEWWKSGAYGYPNTDTLKAIYDPTPEENSRIIAHWVWDLYIEKRAEHEGKTHLQLPKRTKKRMVMIRDRLKEFGSESVERALTAFLHEESWYRANGRLLPEYCFCSTEQMEKQLEAREEQFAKEQKARAGRAAAEASKEVRVSAGSLPPREAR